MGRLLDSRAIFYPTLQIIEVFDSDEQNLITPLSDSSLLIPLGDSIDPAVNRRVHALAARLARDPLEGVSETTPGYAALVVHYDPLALTHAQVTDWVSAYIVSDEIEVPRAPRQVEVPVIYGGEFGLDLESVAAHCGLSVADVIRIHSKTEYTVYMMGFTPGFAYMGKVPQAIQAPRLETPRTKVRAGTLAIAGAQTGIYPVDSPGGWQLIGHTALTLFDPNRRDPFLFAPGDVVRFVVVDR
jgi:KipI family sensor histidine kinase inhibitor